MLPPVPGAAQHQLGRPRVGTLGKTIRVNKLVKCAEGTTHALRHHAFVLVVEEERVKNRDVTGVPQSRQVGLAEVEGGRMLLLQLPHAVQEDEEVGGRLHLLVGDQAQAVRERVSQRHPLLLDQRLEALPSPEVRLQYYLGQAGDDAVGVLAVT